MIPSPDPVEPVQTGEFSKGLKPMALDVWQILKTLGLSQFNALDHVLFLKPSLVLKFIQFNAKSNVSSHPCFGFP